MAEKIIRNYRFRIYPTKRQQETLNAHLEICCELYNAALSERREAWRIERKSISCFDQIYQMKYIRAEREDVRAVNADVLNNVLGRVDIAFKAFFRRCKAGAKPGYPRFRAARRYDSMTFRQIGHALRQRKIRLSKIGWVKVRIRKGQEPEGKIKTLTVKREAGHWFAVLCCEVDSPAPLDFSPDMIGVDVGLTAFATLSNGQEILSPRYYRNAERALRVAQRRVARRKKGSHRRRKAVGLLQRVHVVVRRQRADFHHNVSRSLVNDYGLIAVEKLNIKGLASGILAKSVNDAGWGNFLNMIAYKAASAGRVFVQVNPSGTSQTCLCGAEVRKTLAQRWHHCELCGLSLPRDHVSAQIILQRAASLSGVNVGDLVPCVV